MVEEIEMKKTLLLYLPLLIIMVTDPTYAQHYSKDFLEQGSTGGWSSSLKTWAVAPSEFTPCLTEVFVQPTKESFYLTSFRRLIIN